MRDRSEFQCGEDVGHCIEDKESGTGLRTLEASRKKDRK